MCFAFDGFGVKVVVQRLFGGLRLGKNDAKVFIQAVRGFRVWENLALRCSFKLFGGFALRCSLRGLFGFLPFMVFACLPSFCVVNCVRFVSLVLIGVFELLRSFHFYFYFFIFVCVKGVRGGVYGFLMYKGCLGFFVGRERGVGVRA